MQVEFSGLQTHGIGQWTGNKVLAQSDGRGWRNLNATLATVNGWSGRLDPIKNYCLGFCVNRPARVRRVVSSEREDDTAVVAPRQFLIIPAHQDSQWQRQGSSEMLMIYLRHEMLEQISSEVFGREDVQIALRLGATDPLLEQLALAVLRALQQPDPLATNLYVDGLATAIGAQLVRAHSREVSRSVRQGAWPSFAARGFERLRDFIEASLDQDLSLDVLAEEAGVSVYALPRAFRHHFGATPHQYVLARRMARARELLADTDLPICEVALETGFSSQSHLASSFKNHTGVTPNAYRKTSGFGARTANQIPPPMAASNPST